MNIPKLSEEQKQSCEGNISPEEKNPSKKASKTINHLAMMEYQLNFIKLKLISDSFIECVNEPFKFGEMSSTQRKAVTTLIE